MGETTNEKAVAAARRANADDVVRAIMRRLNFLTVSVIALLLLLGGVAGFAWFNARSTKEALCELRADLQDRVHQTEQFLKDPSAFPEFDNPDAIALIRAQLDNQKSTVSALNDLGC